MKRKGKIHPSPLPQPTAPSSTLQHTSAAHDSLSALNLLPAAILALAAVLSLQDREVLAFMITRSLKTPTTTSINSASSIEESKKFYRRSSNSQLLLLHKPPVFDCECFDCYILYWFRWDSSPNRELIHQAIEAFEEHLANGEVKVKARSSSCNNKRGIRKKKFETQPQIPIPIMKYPEDETLPEAVKVDEVNLTAAVGTGQKGYARRVVADILGVLNSRLWNLWG